MMHARDASGRKVSLLNDDSSSFAQRPLPQRPVSYQSAYSYPSPSSRSNSASPNMPELLRSDSYDSQTSTDGMSPMTPSVDYAFPRPSLYSISQDYEKQSQVKRPSYAGSSRSTSYAEDDVSTPSSTSERPGKRYPCRYRESHGCEKTFTTSGHASRHSKIHTAEKAVQCTYPSCQKKFTRADNMKQHLETHFKDKSRSSSGPRAHKSALSESRRTTSSGRSRTSNRESHSQWETEQYALPSPSAGGAWDMHGLSLPLLNRPIPSRTPSSGLDALAMAVACQEGGRR